MKILVTGATGGLGRELCERLVSQRNSVIGLGRNREIGASLQGLGARFECCALEDRQKLAQLVKEASVVVHAAALSSPWGNWNDFLVANVHGTQNVVNAALAAGVKRFIHISTPSVYYSGKSKQNIEEDSPLPSPRTHYSRSKLAAENIVLNAFKTQNLPAVIIRPRGILGSHDTAIIPRIVRVMQRGWFPVPGSGEAKVDVTAVENVCHSIELAIEAQEACLGRVYNITNSEPCSVEWLLSKIANAVGYKCRFIHVPLPLMQHFAAFAEVAAKMLGNHEPAFTRYSIDALGLTQTLSNARAQTELGYTPQISLEEAIKKYGPQWRTNHACGI